LIAEPITFADALDAAMNEIRQHGRTSTAVTIRLAETLLAIAGKVIRPSDRDALLRQAAMLERGCRHALPEENDQADVHERLRRLHQVLGVEDSPVGGDGHEHAQTSRSHAD
jgi:uncharacterized membrane protein